MDLDEISQIFFEESFEGLDVMESGLLNLEQGEVDPQIINDIFRAAHSIKGGAGTFGFMQVSEFTHVVETLLDEMRSGEREVSKHDIQLLLKSVDYLRETMTQLKNKQEIDESTGDELQKKISSALEEDTKSASSSVDSYDQEEDESNTEESETTQVESLEKSETSSKEDSKDEDVSKSTSTANTARPKSEPAPKTTNKESSSIRVSIEKVDSLLDLVSELVITQSMLKRFGSEYDPDSFNELEEGLDRLERYTRELQENVMDIRMLPISFRFNRVPRLVHDICNQLGKKVDLEIKGGDTELDKTVLEKMGDPLVHIVRNSLDHGIEMPDVRRAAGKSEIGTLRLSASQEGGNIIIRIEDDGAGINTEKILAKARDKGLVGVDEQLTDNEINNLIFHPGLSARDEVSDLSGRGVGLDVVRRNVKDLGGRVEIHSEKGVGSTFTIRLPLTLAILDGQLVRVDNETYIISVLSIVETVIISTKKINKIAGQGDVYQVRGEHIPIVHLGEIFNHQEHNYVGNKTSGLLAVVETDGSRVGILLDELLDQQQVVIKSLEDNFRHIEGLSGATILGDGTVALILDVSGLVQKFKSSKKYKIALQKNAA